MKYFLNLAVFAVIAFCIGCSNYRLAGTPIDLPFKSVYVQPVKNYSYAPQASNLLTNAVSDAISQTPQLKVANKSDADAVLVVEIIDYRKRSYATRRDDTALAAAFKIYATAKCTLSMGGKIIFKDRSVSTSVIVHPVNNDFINSEYQDMPVLMRDLGVKIKDSVIGIW